MPGSRGFVIFVVFVSVAAVSIVRPQGTIHAQARYQNPSAPTDSLRTASPETFADLSGQIIASPGGRPFRKVEVTLLNISSGATLRTYTDVRGRYKFNAIVTGVDYVITPWKPGYLFSPGAMVITHSAVAAEYNFTGEIEPGFFVAPPAP